MGRKQGFTSYQTKIEKVMDDAILSYIKKEVIETRKNSTHYYARYNTIVMFLMGLCALDVLYADEQDNLVLKGMRKYLNIRDPYFYSEPMYLETSMTNNLKYLISKKDIPGPSEREILQWLPEDREFAFFIKETIPRFLNDCFKTCKKDYENPRLYFALARNAKANSVASVATQKKEAPFINAVANHVNFECGHSGFMSGGYSGKIQDDYSIEGLEHMFKYVPLLDFRKYLQKFKIYGENIVAKNNPNKNMELEF